MIQVYLDMDGLLSDFVGGAMKLHGFSIPYAELKWNFYEQVGMTGEEFWKPIAHNPDFWANLEPLADGMDFVKEFDKWYKYDRGVELTILSSGLCPGSVDGKREWLKKYLPHLERGAAFCTEKHRHAHGKAILVDDHDDNLHHFKVRGGSVVGVSRPWNSVFSLYAPKKSESYTNFHDSVFNMIAELK